MCLDELNDICKNLKEDNEKLIENMGNEQVF